MSSNPSIEGTSTSGLRPLAAAPHVKRYASIAMPSHVIVALDFESPSEALQMVHALGEEATHYKIGLQLLTEAGPDLVRSLVRSGKQVFLDLKLHEIPNSVAGAVRAAG